MAFRTFPWSAGESESISSRKSVPPEAASKSPGFARFASVNAPASKPKSSASSIASGMAAQLTSTNGPRRRPPLSCTMRATRPLPVPVSPSTSTVGARGLPGVSKAARRRICPRRSAMLRASPRIASVGSGMHRDRTTVGGCGQGLGQFWPWPGPSPERPDRRIFVEIQAGRAGTSLAPSGRERRVSMVNQEKLEGFVHKALGDIGSALTASLVVIGDKLGLYRAMAAAGPVTSAELAKRTETNERSVREWLAAQAAAGYVEYDATTGRYALPAEHAVALTDEESPACVLGGFQGMTAAMRAAPKVTAAFRTGKGVGWHEHDADLFLGVERFF